MFMGHQYKKIFIQFCFIISWVEDFSMQMMSAASFWDPGEQAGMSTLVTSIQSYAAGSEMKVIPIVQEEVKLPSCADRLGLH